MVFVIVYFFQFKEENTDNDIVEIPVLVQTGDPSQDGSSIYCFQLIYIKNYRIINVFYVLQ